MIDLRTLVRAIPDHPKPGIVFRDVTTLFAHAAGFAQAIESLRARHAGAGVELVAGIEARGFVVGAALAHALGAGFVPLRKRGKLPAETIGHDYELEYGTDRIELHVDAVRPGERVLLVDDLIATGGTALAGLELLRRLGAEVIEACFLVDLPELGGRDRLARAGLASHALVAFEGH
jgi:adenine phosphoribosyltransferase